MSGMELRPLPEPKRIVDSNTPFIFMAWSSCGHLRPSINPEVLKTLTGLNFENQWPGIFSRYLKHGVFFKHVEHRIRFQLNVKHSAHNVILMVGAGDIAKACDPLLELINCSVDS